MKYSPPVAALFLVLTMAGKAFALSSTNIPLDSPIYLYVEKLSGFGLVVSDFKGIRPYSKSEVARLVKEAEERLALAEYPPLAEEYLDRIKQLIPREVALYDEPDEAPFVDIQPVSRAQLRYLYLDGLPRNYYRAVNDPAGDWTFPLLHFRPKNSTPYPVQQRGTEGTPFLENNEGIAYGDGHNLEGRFSGEAHFKALMSALVEPLLLWSSDSEKSQARLNKGYLKVGGGALELELGRDENWLGLGYRGAITLSDNAPNLTVIKLSNPEPFTSKYLWDLKYDLICSRLDHTVTNGAERQPLYFATKLSFKPFQNMEFGMTLGRQVGGPGVDNSVNATLRGLAGATGDDNSNSLAGFELRFRFPWLRNAEIHAELSGEDRHGIWPKMQSYLAGFMVPRLTASGRDDLRFEYFLGHQRLYQNAIFPEGYNYHNFPLGHSQGGATQDFFLRYSHWFSVRNSMALEVIRTTRGDWGRVPVNAFGEWDRNGVMQGDECKYSLRGFWNLPVYGEWNATLMYGWETIDNWNLVPGWHRSNQLLRADVSYRY